MLNPVPNATPSAAGMSRVLLPAVILAAWAGTAVGAPTDGAPERPTRVILIIADGMGASMLSTVAELTRESRGPMAVESMPVVGLVRTASASSPIPDSAASSTAMATGHKAANSAVGWFADGATHPTLLELAEARGMATGLLTTTDLTDATPAAWIARVPDRKLHGAVFEQMVASTVDILAGGLRTVTIQAGGPNPQTRPVGDHADQPSMAPSLRQAADQAGRTVIGDAGALPSSTEDATRVLLALAERPPYTDAFGPVMAETLAAVLPVLATDADGFFVMAEIEETDNAGHSNDTDRAVQAVIEVDDALRAALEFQKANPGVLVILTSDHDTGAFSYDNEGVYTGSGGKAVWISKNHTASRVPIFASGPGQERFGGFMDNTEIFDRLSELLGLD